MQLLGVSLQDDAPAGHTGGWLYNVLLLAAFPFQPVQFSHSVISDSLQPHEAQHARPPYPSPTPGVHPNPCPSSR